MKKISQNKSPKQKTAILIHGWDGNPDEGWFVWLGKELTKRGYSVIRPHMPNPQAPKIGPWVKKLASYDQYINENTVLVGHSVACRTIMKYLEQSKNKVDTCIFVAGWFVLKESTYKEYPGMERELRAIAKPWNTQKLHFAKIRSKMRRAIALFSTNDPYVSVDDAKIFKKELNAKIIIQKNKKHFQEGKFNTIPAVLKEIAQKR